MRNGFSNGPNVAKILHFARLDPVPPRNALQGAQTGKGEIVIFPGIRVEYHHDHPTSPKGRPTGRGGRSAAKSALSA